MTRPLFLILAIFFGTFCASTAQTMDAALIATGQKALSQKMTTNAVLTVLKNGIWNSNRTALAISSVGTKPSILFVFLKQKNNSYLAVDIGNVEGANFGKLGSHTYDRFETVPTSWHPRDDGFFQVMMRTRAWKGPQRYTVSEPLVIRADGVVFWR
jgi:hypothetical protein